MQSSTKARVQRVSEFAGVMKLNEFRRFLYKLRRGAASRSRRYFAFRADDGGWMIEAAARNNLKIDEACPGRTKKSADPVRAGVAIGKIHLLSPAK
jgi:hypothetical protein